MTGFTLGAASGATLGNVSGGTFGSLADVYLLDGDPLPMYTEEIVTFDTITLGFRVSKDVLTGTLRPLKSDEGKVDVLLSDDGGFTAVDRANGANTFTLTPPSNRTPLRSEETVHVNRYEETLVSQTTEEWQVEVEFARGADRTDQKQVEIGDPGNESERGADAGATLGEPSGFTLGGATGASVGNQRTGIPADAWAITSRYGTLATDRVDAEFLGTGEDGVKRFELTARMTFTQAWSFESAVSLLNGVRVKSVPDGNNIPIDETASDANTLTVDSPVGQVVADGDYVVLSWESERLNDAYQTVDIEIAAV